MTAHCERPSRLRSLPCCSAVRIMAEAPDSGGSVTPGGAAQVKIGNYILGDTIGKGTFGKVKCEYGPTVEGSEGFPDPPP